MKLFRFAIATTVATWVLLLIGAAVNPTGSSLACPDWNFVPTCNGEVFPTMAGGVLFEHGHRLWASLVGLLTVLLSVSTFRARTDGLTRRLSVLAVVLVAAQGTLGGLTVLVGLSPALSTLHLATAYGFLGLLVVLCFRLRPAGGDAPQGPAAAPRAFVGIGLLFVLGQAVLGGLVRHLGAGPICGANWLSCAGAGFWPDYPLAQIHMLHRFLAVVVVLVLAWVGLLAARRARATHRALASRLAWVPLGLGLLQAALGVVAVATGRGLSLLVAHTGVAALLVAALCGLYLALGSQAPMSAAEVPGEPALGST